MDTTRLDFMSDFEQMRLIQLAEQGLRFLARNERGRLVAFSEKPERLMNRGCWICPTSKGFAACTVLGLTPFECREKFRWLRWEDEPFAFSEALNEGEGALVDWRKDVENCKKEMRFEIREVAE